MPGRLILLLAVVPLVDIVVLLRVGRMIGFWPTIWLVVLTGVVGVALARWQGLQTLSRLRAELAAGRAPAQTLADGALILLAGGLFVWPGFLTDVLGLALLIPPARSLAGKALGRWFRSRMVVSGFGGPAGPALPDDFHDGWVDGTEFAPRSVKHVENEALRK